MRDIKNFPNFIVDMVLAVLMSFSLTYAMTTSLQFKYSVLTILVLTAGTMTVFSIISINKATLIASAIGLGVICSGYIAYIAYQRRLNAVSHEFFASITWVYDYLDGSDTAHFPYTLYLTCFLCISVSILTFIFAVKKYSFYVLLIGSAGLFASQWMLHYMVSYLPFKLYMLLIILYYFKHIYEKKAHTYVGSYTRTGAFTLWVIPICLVIAGIAFAIPPGEKPIEWKWLDSKIFAVSNYFSRLGNSKQVFEYFSVASTGFGTSRSQLGGKVSLDKTKVLTVESPKGTLYLKGAVRDIYTGSAWLNSDSSFTVATEANQILKYDVNEMFAGTALLAINNQNFRKYFNSLIRTPEYISITYENLKTKSLFIPLKLSSIDFSSNTASYDYLIDAQGNFSSRNMLERGFHYSVNLYDIRYNEKDMQALLRKCKKGLYNDFLSSSAHQNSNSFYRRIAALASMSRNVYKKYLQIPEQLPVRIKDLAVSITASQPTDYDKVKALEQYLSSNYPYTLTPGKTPRKRDFVDYFLFDQKQGYCTYYASAMIVMARSIGIPARYVEGYMLPPSPTSGSTYEVTNEQAHAWVEVYFEGFGWVPFEPTAPFTSAFYDSKDSSATLSSSFVNNPYYKDYILRMQQYGPSTAYSRLGNRDEFDEEGNSNTHTGKVLVIFSTILAVLFGFFSLVFFNSLKTRLRFRKFKKMPSKSGVVVAYKYYLKLLSCLGLTIKGGETPKQFAARVDRYVLFYPVKFSKLTDVFVKARYGNVDISESENKLFLDFHEQALSKAKKELGKIKYFIYHSIAGRF